MAVSIILFIILIYFIAGALFAIPFLYKGIKITDEGAHGSSIGFYIIIIPGVIIFWPVLLKKWMKKRPPPPSRNNRDETKGE